MDADRSKNVADEFMLTEYENIASAHFDSQAGVRQHFRFYLLIIAIPLSVMSFVIKDQGIQNVGSLKLFQLPQILATAFLAIGFVGGLMLLSLIHTALDATLYARTVNGIRSYFVDRAAETGTALGKYLKLPTQQNRPKYLHIRALFWQVMLVSILNSAYILIGIHSIWPNDVAACIAAGIAFLVQVGSYFTFAITREKKEISG